MVLARWVLASVALIIPNTLIAQWATVTMLSPANGTHFTSPTVAVSFRACSNVAQQEHYATVGSTNFIFTDSSTAGVQQCPESTVRKIWSGNVTLQPNQNTLTVSVCNSQVSPCQSASITVFLDVPGITITPHTGTGTPINQGTFGSFQFTVQNTGGLPATGNFAGACGTNTLSCSASPSQFSLGVGASTSVTLSYYGNAAGNATAFLNASYVEYPSTTDQGTVNVTVNAPPPTYAVAVPMTKSVDTSVAQATRDTAFFRVQNNSSNTGTSITFNLTPHCSGVVSGCAVSQSSVTLPEGGQSALLSVAYDVALTGTTGKVTVVASATSPVAFSDSGTTNWVTTPSYSVTVTQGTNPQTLPQQATSGVSPFTIKNTSTNIAGTIKFGLTRTCASIASCSSPADTVILAQSDTAQRSISFNVSPVGTTGSVQMTAAASSPQSFSGSITTTVNATPYYAVGVTALKTPDTLAAPRATTGNTQFKVKNLGMNTTTSVQFTLTATTCSLPMLTCTPPAPVTLNQGDSVTANVSLTVGANGTSGTVALQASATSPQSISATASATIFARPSYTIGVTPATGSQTVGAGTPNSYSVQIQNTSWNTAQAITASLTTPGCGNVILGSCSVASNSNAISQGGLSPTLTLTYNALAVGSETVALNASGTVSGGTVTATNGSVAVTSSTTGSITVATSGLNQRTTIDRGDCLTMAAGQNAAYECGDLRLVHALPSTMTMSSARTPTLMYNSRHAVATAYLNANVTYTGVAPLNLQATVTIPGKPTITKTYPWNPACAGIACRIVVPVQIDSTWLWATSLQVKAISGGFTYATSASLTDTVVTVNRAKSPFGAGWWLEGYESLISVSTTVKLWVGGDGSTRLYTQVSNGIFKAPAYDRPDTVLKVSNSVWRRSLGNGAFVEFDGSGRHTRTVNAMGWVTTFGYNGTKPVPRTITLPTISQSRVYSLAYVTAGGADSILTSITAPPLGASSRVVSTTRTNTFRISAFTDPDGLLTSFDYPTGTSNIISRRRNKLTDTTYFFFDDAGALKESRLGMSRTEGVGAPPIATLFRAAETRSIASPTDAPTPLAKAYSQIDGPRSDVGDTTNFFINRWGAPDTVVNALNMRTRLWRNGSFPALVDSTIGPSGFKRVAYFGTRALMDSTEDVDPYNAACGNRTCNAITRIAYHAIWTKVRAIKGPTGDTTTFFYGNTVAIPDSIQTGSSPTRRTKFKYTTNRQVVSVTEPAGQPDSVFYDVSGNVSKTKTPMGFVTDHFRNSIGADTLVVTPTDAAQTASLKQKTRTKYDIMGRPDTVYKIGAAVSYTLRSTTPDPAPITADTLATNFDYDAEGRVIWTDALAYPSQPAFDIKVREAFGLDARGLAKSRSRNGLMTAMYYDAAGNDTLHVLPGGGRTWQRYDVLGRISSRIVDSVYSRVSAAKALW